jgi:hypothetical protein
MSNDQLNNGFQAPPASGNNEYVDLSKTERTTTITDLAQNSSVPNPEVLPPANSTPPLSVVTQESQKKPSFLLPLIFTFIFTVLVIALSAGGYAVAYEKIKLPDKYQNIQEGVMNLVQGLPFTMKTPKFLLAKAIVAQEKIKKESYDISIAADSASFSVIPGLSGIDLSAKGSVDYTDPKDIKFSLDAFVTKDLNFEILRPTKLLYFRVKKIPDLLLSFAGIKSDTFDPILNKWYSYDPTPLETEARKDLGTPDQEVPSQKYVSDSLDKLADEKVLSEMKVSEDIIDGFPVYKISFTPDSNMIDYLGRKIDDERGALLDTDVTQAQKLSDIVKSLSWEVDIDKKEYYIRKTSVKSHLEVDKINSYESLFLGSANPETGPSKIDIAFAAKFSDFGKNVTIEEPKDSSTWEDFTNSISEIFLKQYEENSLTSYQRSVDNKAIFELNQINSGLVSYKKVCGEYPENLTPLTDSPKALGCSENEIPFLPVNLRYESYYYALNSDKTKFDLCTNLSTPIEAFDNCPNKSYNYHLPSSR